MSENKAAFAERTKRFPKNILYRYMEDNGDKYIHKLTQFVTTLSSRRNCSIDLVDTSREKRPFVSVGITRLVLMFRKAFNIHF